MTEELNYPWKEEQERILKKWADKGQCFKAMHERAYKRFWCLNAWFTIPVIIMSTVAGTGNFAQNLFGPYAQFSVLAIGGINLLSGIITTVGQFSGVAQKLESHRIAAISWDKFARKIQVELAKSRIDRTPAKDFVSTCQETYDRLIEVSPIMPNDIIRWFNNMVETGYFEEDLSELNTCCYECFCFPCGCKAITMKTPFHTNPKKQEQLEELKKAWKEIELPEILGRIKPTEIAIEPVLPHVVPEKPKLPSPLAMPKERHARVDYNFFNIDDKDEV
jgi:hypothetical protein